MLCAAEHHTREAAAGATVPGAGSFETVCGGLTTKHTSPPPIHGGRTPHLKKQHQQADYTILLNTNMDEACVARRVDSGSFQLDRSTCHTMKLQRPTPQLPGR